MKDTRLQEKSTPGAPNGAKDGVKKVKMPRKITAAYLENSGKFYLEKFPASTSHFRTVMQRKIRRSATAHPDTDVDASFRMLDDIISRFTELGFLDDRALAKGLVYSWTQRGWSHRKILATLNQKGISSDIIETLAKEDAPSSADDFTAALRWIRKKRLGAFSTKSEDQQDRWLSSLARAGFDYETSRRALALPKDEIEDLLRDVRL